MSILPLLKERHLLRLAYTETLLADCNDATCRRTMVLLWREPTLAGLLQSAVSQC